MLLFKPPLSGLSELSSQETIKGSMVSNPYYLFNYVSIVNRTPVVALFHVYVNTPVVRDLHPPPNAMVSYLLDEQPALSRVEQRCVRIYMRYVKESIPIFESRTRMPRAGYTYL